MIKINDRSINDILKKKDAVERFENILGLLYLTFIDAAKIEYSAKSFVHFVEAFSIFLSFNCERKKMKEMDISKLLERAMAHMPVSDESTLAVSIQFDDDSAIDYLENHTEKILLELFLYPNPECFSETNSNVFSAYLSSFILSDLMCLDYYEDKIPCTFEIIMGLYNFCESASSTNNLKGKKARKFFSYENVKSWVHEPI